MEATENPQISSTEDKSTLENPQVFEKDSTISASKTEKNVQEAAQSIVSKAVEAASLQYGSSGDFSLLHDAPLTTGSSEPKASKKSDAEISDRLDDVEKDEVCNPTEEISSKSKSNLLKDVSIENKAETTEKSSLEGSEDLSDGTLKPGSKHDSTEMHSEKSLSQECSEVKDQNDSKVEETEESSDIKPDKNDIVNLLLENDNAKPNWLDILGNKRLRKQILISGDGESTRPQKKQEATIEIETAQRNGYLIEEEKTVSFIVGDFDMPEAIDLSVNLMEINEKCVVISDVRYCYPRNTPTVEVPEDEIELLYIIKLIDVKEGPYSSSASIEKRLDWTEKKRKMGNHFFAHDNLEEAKHAYKKCTRVLEIASSWKDRYDEETQAKIQQSLLKACNNLTVTLIKLNQWEKAMDPCSTAERIDRNNVKTLFQKGKIHSNIGQHYQAIVVLKKALSLSPNDKSIRKELIREQKRLATENEAERKMYKRMLLGNAPTKPSPDQAEAKKKSWLSSSGLMLKGSLFVLGSAILLGVYMMHR